MTQPATHAATQGESHQMRLDTRGERDGTTGTSEGRGSAYTAQNVTCRRALNKQNSIGNVRRPTAARIKLGLGRVQWVPAASTLPSSQESMMQKDTQETQQAAAVWVRKATALKIPPTARMSAQWASGVAAMAKAQVVPCSTDWVAGRRLRFLCHPAPTPIGQQACGLHHRTGLPHPMPRPPPADVP